MRLGLRYVKGLRQEAAERLEEERLRGPFQDADNLVRRCLLRRDELDTLAAIGALSSLGLSRRTALWQVARAARPSGPLFAASPQIADPSPLPEMTPFDETLADYAGSSLTAGPHPLSYLRPQLERRGVVPTVALGKRRRGERIRIAGSVIVRQRPGTAKGVLFITLEDETGMAQAIVAPKLLHEHRQLIVGAAGLIVEGELEKRDGTLSLRAERFWRLSDLTRVPSHDFH